MRFALLQSCLLLGLSFAAGAAVGVTPEEPAETRRFEIEIRDRQALLEGNVVRVSRGDRVELVWSTDEPVQLHLHGYDLEVRVTPGEPAVQSFEARATGRFPVTSHGFGGEHHGHETLLYVEVYPD